MYHKAYQHAMLERLYTNDGSADEIDGEPVPTLQADEYLAMAMHRWFGSQDGANEYKAWESAVQRNQRFLFHLFFNQAPMQLPMTHWNCSVPTHQVSKLSG